MSLVLRAAGEHYAEAVSDGAVTDRGQYLEAFGLYEAVTAEAEALAASDEAAVAEIGADDARPGAGGGGRVRWSRPARTSPPRTPACFTATAARMELAALKLR